MSDTAEIIGPMTRKRRTTIAGNGKQANGGKWHEAGDKPPQNPSKRKTTEVSKQASRRASNGKQDRDMEVRGAHQPQQQQLSNSPKKEKSVGDDINEKLR